MSQRQALRKKYVGQSPTKAALIWGLSTLLLLASWGCGGGLRWMRPIEKETIELKRAGVYQLRAPRPKGASCALYQNGQPIVLDGTGAKRAGVCTLQHFLHPGKYQLHIKQKAKKKKKRASRYRRRYRRRYARRRVPPKPKKPAKPAKAEKVKPKPSPKRWLLAYEPRSLAAGGQFSANFAKRDAPIPGAAPFVPLQSATLKVSTPGLYRLEGTGVTGIMQLFSPKGGLLTESRGGQRGLDCMLHAYLKPGHYPVVLTSKRAGPFSLRSTRIETTALAPGKAHSGKLKRSPASVGYTLRLKTRTLLQLAVESKEALVCDLFNDEGTLLTRFRGKQGCKTARPLAPGTYALQLHSRTPTAYTARLSKFSTKPLATNTYKHLALVKGQPLFFRFETKRAGNYVVLSQSGAKPQLAVYNANYQRQGKVYQTRSYFHMTMFKLGKGTHYFRMLPTKQGREESAIGIFAAATLTGFSSKRSRSSYMYRTNAFQFFRLNVSKRLAHQVRINAYPTRYSLSKHMRMGCGLMDGRLRSLGRGRVVGRRCTLQKTLAPGKYYIYSIVRITPPRKKVRRGVRTKRVRGRLTRAAFRGRTAPRARRPGVGAEATKTLRKIPKHRYRLSMYVRSNEEHHLKLSPSAPIAYKTTQLAPKGVVKFRFHNRQAGLYLFETSGKEGNPNCSLRINQRVGSQWTFIRSLTYDNDGGEGLNCRILARLEAGYYTYQVKAHYKQKGTGKLTATLKRLDPKTRPLPLGIPTPPRKIRPNTPDLFALEVKRAAFYQILTAGHSDPNCAIYNGRFRLAGAHRDKIPGQNLNCALATFLYPGRYTLMVSLGNRHFAARKYRVLWRPYQFNPERRLLPGQPFVAGPLQAASPHIYLVAIPRDGFYRIETTGPSDPSCRLYSPSYEQLGYNKYIHYRKNLNCRIIRYLKRGQYMLRVRLYRAKYSGRPYEVAVSPYPARVLVLNRPNKIDTIRSRIPLVYQMNIAKDGLYRIQTKSGPFTNCVLYAGTSKQIARHGWYGCSITRHLRKGRYTLQVNFSSVRPTKGSLVAEVSVLSPQELAPGRGLTLPALQAASPTLLKLRVPRNGFYQISATGRARSRCELFEAPFKRIAKTAYGNYKCRLAHRLKRGDYYLRIRPYNRYDAGKAIRLTAKRVAPKVVTLQKGARVALKTSSASHFFQVKITKSGFYHFGSFTGLSSRCFLYDATRPKAIATTYTKSCSITKGLAPGRYTFQVVPRIYRYQLRRGKRFALGVRVRRLVPQPLRLGTPARGTPLTRNKPHFYQFKAPRDGLYLFRSSGTSDPWGALYNSFYQQTDTAKDVYSARKSRRRGGLGAQVGGRSQKLSDYNFRLSAFLRKGKLYYLRVASQRSWRTRGKPYALKISAQRQLLLDLPINRALTATPLQLSAPHFYRIRINKPGRYELETSGRSDPACSLFDASGKRLATHDDIFYKRRSSKNNLNCRITRKLAAGEYIVQVGLGTRQYAGRPYTLEIERVQKKRRTPIARTPRPDDNRRAPSEGSAPAAPTPAADTGNQKEDLDKELSKDN